MRFTFKKLKLLVLVFPLFYFENSNCQNLVDNPSFENYSECPSDNTFYATGWDRVAHHYGTVDYFNTCAPFSYVSVPSNYLGNQETYDGNAYIGLTFCNPITSFREYVQTKLLSPLIAEHFYKVSFFVSLTDNSTHAMNNIGVAFTTNPIIGNDDMEQLVVNPQINSSIVISDKINWVEVSGVFKANGGEEFLTLGNFQTVAETTEELLIPTEEFDYLSYYLIDSVKVVQTEEPPPTESDCLNFVNPIHDVLTLEITNDMDVSNIVIFDMAGKSINRKIVNNQISLGDLQDGVYIVHYVCGRKNKYKKIIKI